MKSRLLALLCLFPFASHAQDWGQIATVSETLGVSADHLCLGEASRGDIGCPVFAPYVDHATGNVGIGTASPTYSLEVIPANNYMRLGASDSEGQLLLGNGTSTAGYFAPAVYGHPINPARFMSIVSQLRPEDDTGTVPAIIVTSRVSPSAVVGIRPTVAFRNSSRTDMQIMADGKVGIATTTPQTALHVSGTLRIADSGEACDANRAGALKYSGGNFYACNGSAWSALGTAGGVVSDRITSNTTGITVQTGGVISITTNGSTANYFDTSGRLVTAGISVTTLNGVSSTNGYFSRSIGIGKANPGALLQIETTGTTPSQIRVGATGTGSAGIYLDAQDGDFVGSDYASFYQDDAGPVYLKSHGPNPLYFLTSNTQRVTIDSAGLVGIGTTAPNATLDVSGSVNIGDGSTRGQFTYSPANGLRLWNMDNSVLTLGTTGAERLRISADGKVGVGLTAPAYPLDVSGTVRASGEVISTNANQFRMVNGNYGAFWRNDGTNLYLLFTASGDQYGNWNTLRPFTANLTTGAVTMSHGLTVGGTVAATSFSGDGSGLTGVIATNADTLDGLDSTQFVRKDADSVMTDGIGIRFGHANQTNTADGMIAAGRYASGLNIVGTQTVAGQGRIIRLWGNLLDSGGSTYWHAGNDGSGSGLDADTVDGVQASGLLTKAGVTSGNACIGNGTTVDCSDANVGSKDDITTRTPSGFWQTSTATTAEGWPVTSNNWYHLLTSTHSNTSSYYSMQFAGDFFNSNNIFYRATNNSGAAGWNRLWHSGNDGTGSGLDADTLDGVDGAGFLRREVSTWQSSSEGQPRYYFVSGGRTYFKSGNNGDGIAVSFRDSTDADRVLIAHNGNIWSSILGVWLTDWLNQSVKTTANVTFSNLYLTGLGDWITNRLGQDVRAGASPYFAAIDTNGTGMLNIHGGIRTRRGLTSWGTATNYFSINWTGSAAQLYIDSSNMGTISLSSDRRLKKGIETLSDATGGLSKIMQLNPVSFHWKNTADDPALQFGLIAQEVSPVFPNLVRNTGMKTAATPDGILKIEYQGLIAPMIKAIQELKIENDALKAKVEAANDNFARLEKEIEALKRGR